MSRMKYVGALIVASAAALACVLPAGAHATTGVPKDPILFVHGFTGNGSNWRIFKERLAGDGYNTANTTGQPEYDTDRTSAVSLGFLATNTYNAYVLRHAVDDLKARTGASKVDIVTHSMGGVSSRYYLKYLGGTSSVDEWVSIAGPNHGLNICYLLPIGPQPCAELVPSPLGLFMNALNEYRPWPLAPGDETPGDVRYLTVRSPADTTVPSGVPLNGATNVKTTNSPSHNEMIVNDEVYNIVRGFLD